MAKEFKFSNLSTACYILQQEFIDATNTCLRLADMYAEVCLFESHELEKEDLEESRKKFVEDYYDLVKRLKADYRDSGRAVGKRLIALGYDEEYLKGINENFIKPLDEVFAIIGC